MGEGLLARARRVVEAGVGSVVEGAERLAGPALMRQAVRDVEHAIDDARRQQRRARRRATEAAACADRAEARAAKLTEEARYALSVGREDLAAAAVAQKLAAEGAATEDRAAAREALAAAEALEAPIADLVARHRKLEEELRAHLEAEQIAPAAAAHPFSDDRVVRAEASFARARADSCARDAESDTAVPMVELHRLRREDAVAKALAALRAEPGQPAPRARKR